MTNVVEENRKYRISLQLLSLRIPFCRKCICIVILSFLPRRIPMNEGIDSSHLFCMIGNGNVFDVVLLCRLSDFWRGFVSCHNFPNSRDRQCRETSFTGWHGHICCCVLGSNAVPTGLAESGNFGMNIGIVFVEQRFVIGNADDGICFHRRVLRFVYKYTRHTPLFQFGTSCDDQAKVHKVFIGG